MRLLSRRWGLLCPVSLLTVLVLLAACGDEPAKPRKQQVVKLLPDTPPPPPPPPKPEDRPPPKPDDKPQPQDAPKPADEPQAQALKTDEAPGQGAGSGLGSGTVKQDYRDGVIGGAPAGGAQVGGNRLAAATYANATTRAINDFLQREKELRRADYRLQVHVWLQPDGRVQRAELVGSSGDSSLDSALRDALQRFPGTAAPPPERLPQPLRLQVSNRTMG
jgi:protein TonB